MSQGVRACPLCGAVAARPFLDDGTPAGLDRAYHVVVCAECGLRYTRPLPTPAEIAALYPDAYYGDQRPRLLSWDTARRLLHLDVLWQRRRALLGRPPGTVLDVGCGDGDFLASLKRRGWAVQGTEFSAAACARARQRGVAVHHGDLASAALPSGAFDVVTLWHVLEHLPEPGLELGEARRLLRDDGLLVIEVPNSASPTVRLCRERWFPLDVPRHLQHFTPATLDRLLRQSGFTTVHRQDFHHLDFVLSFISFMNRSGVLGRFSGDHYFVSDFRRAGLPAKLRFLALGLLAGGVSLPYSLLATALSGHGETVTVTARKAAV